MKRLKSTHREPARELVSDDLIERCKAGDQEAWTQLVGATHREVYTLCMRILRDPDDAAEATQDTYVKVWRGLKGFRGDAQFTTWLYRVAANAAISLHRSRKRRVLHETGADEESLGRLAGGTTTVEETVGSQLEVRDVERAIATLPDHYRAAVVLRDIYGLTIEEIARELKISETAAKVRVHRARRKLKEIVFAIEDG